MFDEEGKNYKFRGGEKMSEESILQYNFLEEETPDRGD